MPNYDRVCSKCGVVEQDCLEPITFADPTCIKCEGSLPGTLIRTILGGTMEHPLVRNNVVSDECDVIVRNGLCDADGTPRRFTSKSDMARVAAERGLTNYVVHEPGRSSDKNPHTSRWV